MDEYIERDAVHDLVRSLAKYAWTFPNNTGHRVTVDADDVNFGVDKIPAADVAPVRHGRWECNKPCPVCGRDRFEGLDADIWADWQPDYCPNCGCRMDGGNDE